MPYLAAATNITIMEKCAIATVVVSAITVILSMVRMWQNRSEKKLTQLVNTTRTELLTALASNMERQFSSLDKSTYVTLDYRMDGDTKCLRIPLAFDKVTECLQGMRLQLLDHNEVETIYSVSTLGFDAPVRLHWHYHEETETVQVIKGSVTDVQTGRKYKAGEVWVIPPGHRHIADFDNAYTICTVRPPLPLAAVHPIQLEGAGDIYAAPAPSKNIDVHNVI